MEIPKVSEFLNLGGTIVSTPCVAIPLPSIHHDPSNKTRTDCFALGEDNRILHKQYDGTEFKPWEVLKVPHLSINSALSAVARGENSFDIFCRAADFSIHRTNWNGSHWSEWEDMGGVWTSAPAVCTWGEKRMDLFARAPDGSIQHKFWDGSIWTKWHSLGGVSTSAPAAISWGPDRIDLFHRGTDFCLWHQWWIGGVGWQKGWENLGGKY